MINLPNLKKYAVFAAGAVVIFGGVIFFRQNNATVKLGTSAAASGESATPAVTYEEYKKSATTALNGMTVNDQASVERAMDKLLALRVPREGMGAHLELATAVQAYRDALKAKDPVGSAVALNRLRVFVRANSWIGLSL